MHATFKVMAAKGEYEGLSEEIYDVTCTFCSRKNRVKEAQKYCTDCRKNLCADCVDIHKEHNEAHTLVDEFDEEEEASLLTEKCKTHTNELIQRFCVDHDELVCNVCALSDHRQCRDLKQITELFQDLHNDRKILMVQGQLRSALQTVDEMITKLDQHIDALSEKENTFLEMIEDYTTRLLSKIEELKRNATTKVTTKHRQLATDATERRAAIANVKKDIRKCLKDAVKSDVRTARRFILHKKGQTLLRKMETFCRDSDSLMRRSVLSFVPDWRIEKSLGDFDSHVVCVERYKASSKGGITLSAAGDSNKPCDIEACCLLSDGTVLLLDDFNKRLKRIDPSTGCVKDLYEIDSHLWGITLIGQHEVAVCTGSRVVQVVSLVDTMKTRRKLKLKNKCHRIVHSNGELFISDERCVYVSDLTGRELRTIYKNKSGQCMFSNISGIALNKTGDRLYVADPKKGIICTDRGGQEVFRLSEKELGLSVAPGVCTDQRGNVLVNGYRSNNVVQITGDGQVLGEIVSQADGIDRPRCMCYDEGSHRLYVAGRSPNLMVFTLV